MSWFSQTLTSSIGKKLLMALTGLFLISFLVIHATINAMIFYNDGGETFTHWGHFMGTNPIVRTLEIGLIAGFFFISRMDSFFGKTIQTPALSSML